MQEKPHLSLKHVYFRYCDMILDEPLSTLAIINTLQCISLCSLKDISTSGINNMINQLKNQLTYVHLEDMYFVIDNIIIALGSLKKLDHLALENLNRLTNQGVRRLLDKLNQNIVVKPTIKKMFKHK